MKWKRTDTGYVSQDGRWRLVRDECTGMMNKAYSRSWHLFDGSKQVLTHEDSATYCKEYVEDAMSADQPAT